MSYSLSLLILGIFTLNIYLIFIGIFALLINYFYETLDEEKDRLIKQKQFNMELKKSGRLN